MDVITLFQTASERADRTVTRRWRGAPKKYGPHKTLYNRWKRWSDKGIFAKMFIELAKPGDQTDTLMINATHLKAHRTAASLRLKKGAKAE